MELVWWQKQRPSSSPSHHRHDGEAEETDSNLTAQQLRDLKRRREFERLVRREERIGKQKLYERRRKQGLIVESSGDSDDDDDNDNYDDDDSDRGEHNEQDDDDANDGEGDSTSQRKQQQRRRRRRRSSSSYMEFDGPCVICLEPDLESRQDLMTLRQVLQQEGGLGASYSPFCATATVDPALAAAPTTVGAGLNRRRRGGDFRPMIPVASFATVSEAIPVAQRLRKLWEPLQWEVTDLHILESAASHERQQQCNGLDDGGADDGTAMVEAGTQAPSHLWGFSPRKTQAALSLDKRQMMMGCSAMISLYGEEMEMDDELNQEMANLVARSGHDGGGTGNGGVSATNGDRLVSSSPSSIGIGTTVDDLNVQQHGSIEDITAFLDDDDDGADYDEGTVVVIGRVHFFTGDARIYQGMPATSSAVYDLPATYKKSNSKTSNTTKSSGKREGR